QTALNSAQTQPNSAAQSAAAAPNSELTDFSELHDQTYFGNRVVEHAQTFVVKMDKPVYRVQGVASDHGFTVTVPNSLALTNVSELSKGHPRVDYAAIINYGNFSRLTVQFLPGAIPEYRVQASGSTLEIAIENQKS